MVSLLTEVSLSPHIVPADEGDVQVVGPEYARVILSSAATGGAFTMAEVRIDAPKFGPPYHVHTREDETFLVQEGELVLIVDGARHTLRAGDVAFAPRHVPHRFESGPNGVRFHILVTGSNFERFYPRYCEAASRGDFEAIPGIAQEHGIAFLPE